MLDDRNWNRELMGKNFLSNLLQQKKYRTILFMWNHFVESLRPLISDPIDVAPLDEMKPLPA